MGSVKNDDWPPIKPISISKSLVLETFQLLVVLYCCENRGAAHKRTTRITKTNQNITRNERIEKVMSSNICGNIGSFSLVFIKKVGFSGVSLQRRAIGTHMAYSVYLYCWEFAFGLARSSLAESTYLSLMASLLNLFQGYAACVACTTLIHVFGQWTIVGWFHWSPDWLAIMQQNEDNGIGEHERPMAQNEVKNSYQEAQGWANLDQK